MAGLSPSKTDGPSKSYDPSLPPHIHEILIRACAELQVQQLNYMPFQDNDQLDLSPREVRETTRGQTVPRRHARARQQQHQRDGRQTSGPPGLAPYIHETIQYSTQPTGPGYSYSHAPRTRFGDQQSDPHRRIQIQVNYMDSLALRIPDSISLTAELQAKENFRAMLAKISQETLESYAKTRGYSVGPKAIDFKCFGSLRNGFALPGADLDLVMTTRPSSFPQQLEAECPQVLEKAFADAGLDACLISKTRVPIIKLSDKSGTGIRCDINFSGRLAIYNTELLRCYALCDERIRMLGVFVKMWAKARRINSPYHGTMCSYGYILMVIHYLVNIVGPPLAPNLQLAAHGKATTIDGYDVLFFNNEAELRARAKINAKFGNQQSVGSLLRGFFAYYGSRGRGAPLGGFDWVNKVISIRTPGGILPKADKGWNCAKVDEKGHRLRYLIAIEDPFELDHNVARTVTHSGLTAIRAEFRRAHTIINRVQEIPGLGWEWRHDDGDVGEDFLAEPGSKPNNASIVEPETRSAPVCGPIEESGALKPSHNYQYSPNIVFGTSSKAQEQQEYRENFRRHTTSTANNMKRLLHMPAAWGSRSSQCSARGLNQNHDQGFVSDLRSEYPHMATHTGSNHQHILCQEQPNTSPCLAGVVLDPRQFHSPSAIRDRASICQVPNCKNESTNSHAGSSVLANKWAISTHDLLSALPFYEGNTG
ncbi:hypothetical protein MPDQ_003995 [Monascus purpureus]|uniref:polynucleotide adenylyltransferase n=1 Tax=Monascus purpureus TaxID=5098 RepID=A0A507R2R3_MONPU|nr:hypothetical protein MPDQ_003995 [Monascus purpureus]